VLQRDLWRRAHSREGRNEQRKLRASLLNAIAITMLVAALIGPYVNPALGDSLMLADRLFLFGIGVAVHLLAALAVRDMEDK